MFANKVILVGNITRQPELKVLDSGKQVTQLSVAINERYTKADGTKAENTTFVSVGVFGPQAENCAKYLVKGQKVWVEGKISNRAIEKPDGTKEYKTGVVAKSVQFGPKPKQEQEYAESHRGKMSTAGDDNNGVEYPTEEINADEIPF